MICQFNQNVSNWDNFYQNVIVRALKQNTIQTKYILNLINDASDES